MAQLAISKDYFVAYARLPRKAQRKADEFLGKFQKDSTSAALHLEPLHRTVDPWLRSARIGDDYRVILRAPERGDVYLILWADHHDEAYRWAATKQTAIHPATGSLQIFDAVHATQVITTAHPDAVEELPLPQTIESREAPALFAARSDDELYLAGVPKALMPSVRAVGTEEELDLLLPHLPPEAGEVLTALAAGLALDDALEEVLGRATPVAGAAPPPEVDVTDVPAALERQTTQRQFRLFDGSIDLDAALRYPLDVWRVFLHPRQRRIAHARTKGPVRVLGGAGTGKTVVALHRAAFLVREVFTKPDDRVLFTTFTTNLAEDIHSQLAKLLEPDHLARVEVVNIDRWASQVLRGRGKSVNIAFDEAQREHLDNAIEIYGQDDIRPAFYRAEWRDVVQEQGILGEDEYVLAVRKYRGMPLARTERRRLWPVFAAYRDGLTQAGLVEPIDLLRRARLEVETQRAESGGASRYRAVVVDEAQDFSAEALKLVRAIAGPEQPDDLFLVGDAHQRIYGRPVSLTSCGIHVRGRRSQTLRLNYRTTAAICRWSMRVLKDVEVDDLDEGKADRRGYVSVREGPAPTVRVFVTAREESAAVVETVRAALAAGVAPDHICIVARTRGPLVDRLGPALESAGLSTVMLDGKEPRKEGVRLSTMHRVKGLEFPIVLLAAVSRGDVPLSTEELSSEDPAVAARALLRERSLLYVAASRARDELFVSAVGAPSTLLEGLLKTRSLVPPRRTSAPAMPAVSVATQPPPTRPTANQLGVASIASPDGGTSKDSPQAASAADRLQAALAAPLAAVYMSARLVNWAKRTGVTTLGDLAQRSPADMLQEKNLGRTSVKEARALIESHTGMAWEDVRALGEAPALFDVSPDGPAAFEAAATAANWNAMRSLFTEGQRATPLGEVKLPARVRRYVEVHGMATVGDLAQVTQGQLSAAPNLGRTSVQQLPGIVFAHFAAIREEDALVDLGLVECWRTLLQGLDPMPRIILSRRSGLAGEVTTLQELGDTFGVTRERIRQLETRSKEQLARRRWAREARRRIEEVLCDGAAPLAQLERDAWWAGAKQRADVVGFVVDDVLDIGASVIEIDDEPWLSRVKLQVVTEAWSALRSRAEELPFPVPAAALDDLVLGLDASLGVALSLHLRTQLRESARVDETGRIMSLGDSRKARLLAVLRGAPTPMRMDELEAIVGGRVLVPDEALHFGKGTIGLRQHIEDFEGWRARLVPRAVEIVTSLGPERQWSCSEILDELRESEDLPEWMTPWVLAALIKAGQELSYLGRLRVALPGAADGGSRIFVFEAFEKLLRDEGAPMSRDLLLERTRARIGVSTFTLNFMLSRPPLVRVDADRMGLLDRDVPGGAAAITEAADHAANLLARRGRGISGHHIHVEVQLLSDAHAMWTEELTVSTLRTDGRFRFAQTGAVGLAEWESTRMPTRLELARSALEEGEGRVSVEAVAARIEANYGERPSRATLGALAMNVGAGLDGEWIVRRSVVG